jgi:hypothetical protein
MKHHKPITKLPTLAQAGGDGADTLKGAQSAFFVTLTNQIIDIVYSKRR